MDFLETVEEQPVVMVAVKSQDRTPDAGLRYFHERYGFPGVQRVADLHQENEAGPLKLRRALDWLEDLGKEEPKR